MSVDLLRQCHYFVGMYEEALEAAAASAHQRLVPGGEFFFRQGEVANHFYVLATGHARLSQITPEGKQVIMGMIGPRQEVGIIAAIEGAVYPLDLQAVQDSEALVWDRRTLGALFEAHPMLALRALRMVSGRFVELQDRYRELATERVERRVARALLRLVSQIGRPEGSGVTIAIPLARQDLAEMTGTTLFTVSRILSTWETEGIVSTGRERVTLADADRLTRIAEDLP